MISWYLIFSYAIYIANLVFCWLVYSEDYTKTHIKYWDGPPITDKQLIILTFGVIVFPPLVLPYWIIKSVVKNIYKMVKHIKSVFSSDSPWWY
jgi:hypothetical protein